MSLAGRGSHRRATLIPSRAAQTQEQRPEASARSRINGARNSQASRKLATSGHDQTEAKGRGRSGSGRVGEGREKHFACRGTPAPPTSIVERTAVGNGRIHEELGRSCSSAWNCLSGPDEPYTRPFLSWIVVNDLDVLVPVSRSDGRLEWVAAHGAPNSPGLSEYLR